MKFNPTFLEVLILLLVSLTIYVWVRFGRKIKRCWKDWHKRHRSPGQLRPRSPEDCPACAIGVHWLPRRPRQEVVPWSEVKNKVGAKKQIDTTGYACMNPECKYRGITDAAIHTLVSDGPRGIRQDIPLCWPKTLVRPQECLKLRA